MAHNQQENSNLADDFIREAAAAAAAAETASRDSTLSWENVQQPQPTNVAAVQPDPWQGKELPQTRYQNVATGDAWKTYNQNSPSQSSQPSLRFDSTADTTRTTISTTPSNGAKHGTAVAAESTDAYHSVCSA